MDAGSYRNGIKAYTPFFDMYRRHAGRRHADIGVGTGYFVDQAGLDARVQRLPHC